MTNTHRDAFDSWVESLGLRYFKPYELRFLGNSHHAKGKSHGLNCLPPVKLWESMVPTIRAADEARHRLGSPLVILSAYRSPAYNAAIGGAKYSRHMSFDALDLTPTKASIAKLLAVVRQLRKEKQIIGGIGKYSTFVHIDNRGTLADF